MLDQKHIELIDRKLRQLHESHIGQLLSITNRLVGQIEPNSNAMIAACLKAIPQETLIAVASYGDEIGRQVSDTVTALNIDLDEIDKERLIALAERYLDESIYETRFQAFLDSIQRQVGRYGISIDLQQYRADISKSLHDVGIKNTIRSKIAKLQNELDLLILRNSSKEKSDAGPFRSFWLSHWKWIVGTTVAIVGVLSKEFQMKYNYVFKRMR